MEVVLGTFIVVFGLLAGNAYLERDEVSQINNELNNELITLKSENKKLASRLKSKQNKKIVKKETPKIDGIEIAYLGD